MKFIERIRIAHNQSLYDATINTKDFNTEKVTIMQYVHPRVYLVLNTTVAAFLTNAVRVLVVVEVTIISLGRNSIALLNILQD